jgi:hypothetical protein
MRDEKGWGSMELQPFFMGFLWDKGKAINAAIPSAIANAPTAERALSGDHAGSASRHAMGLHPIFAAVCWPAMARHRSIAHHRPARSTCGRRGGGSPVRAIRVSLEPTRLIGCGQDVMVVHGDSTRGMVRFAVFIRQVGGDNRVTCRAIGADQASYVFRDESTQTVIPRSRPDAIDGVFLGAIPGVGHAEKCPPLLGR